jgi:hypothetical protein
MVKNVLLFCCHIGKNYDSSVSIVLGYGLDDWGSRVQFAAGAGNFSHHHMQNSSGDHPASYPMSTRGSFPGGGGTNQGVKLTTHLLLVPRSKNEWSYTSILPIHLHGMVIG